MKKLLIFLVVPFLLAGCNSADKVVCTSNEEEINGVKSTVIATAEIKDGKVSDLSIQLSFDDKDTAKSYCDLYETMNDLTTDETQKVKVTCTDNTLTFDDYRVFLDEGDKIIGLTKDEFISQMETDGVTCK